MKNGVSDDPGVSIAMATYNGEAHILQQLESLASQTVTPLEIVITDDGSTDKTLAIAAAFAERAPFPVYIHRNEQRLLFANNFLRAASLCSGSLIAFCDQDDVWHPKKLETCLPFFVDPQVLLSAHTSEVWDGTKTNAVLYPAFAETNVHAPLTLDPFDLVPGFVMVIRRELLRVTANDRRLRNVFSSRKAATPMGHDQWVWFLAATLGKIATIQAPQALYRQHTANVVGAPKKSGRLYNLTLSMSEVDYVGLAELEAEAITRLEEIAGEATSAERMLCSNAIAAFKARCKYHAARAQIYDRRNWMPTRVRAFFRILVSGGYQEDKAGYHLGRKAEIKDAIFGVTGIFKIAGISQK